MPNYYDPNEFQGGIDPSLMQMQQQMPQQPTFGQRFAQGARGLLGNQDLALALLANSGSSPQKRTFGEILGQSGLQANQMAQQRQDDAFRRQLQQAQLAAVQSRPQSTGIGEVPVDKYTLESLARFQKTHQIADLVEKTGTIGKLNPGDYTPDSLAAYQTSGNPGNLVRYTPPAKVGSGKAPAASGFDDPRIQALQASMVSAGYSPPAGFRSKEQQLSMYQGLLKKYDGLSPDDIAHLAASNAIDYKAVGKATQAAATMGGRVEVANNELRGFVPIAKDASAAVDRGSFVPYNRLKQKGQAAISDPNLKRLFVATQTVLNAYDVLAARGGTDKDKRAENHRILENADSPEAYNAALDMIIREGQAAGKATSDAMRSDAYGYPSGAPKSTAADDPLGLR